MYDNIDLTIYREHCPRLEFIKDIPEYLTSVSNQGINDFGEYVIGYLDSLKVSVTNNRVSIFGSSLCKYYLGDNFRTLSKGDTKRAIESISDKLHLPFAISNVTRIDLAHNLIMKFPVNSYYPILGTARYYDRLEQNNGLYYNNRIRQIVIYGKEHEKRLKRQPIPKLYLDRNVLRIELRFRKRLRQQLKQSEILARFLYEESFYYLLVKRWRDEYLGIQKINTKLKNMEPTGSKKKFMENLALFTVLELGQPQVLAKIKEWQERDEISKKQAYDLRTTVKQLSGYSINESGHELINEINRKVKEAARYS